MAEKKKSKKEKWLKDLHSPIEEVVLDTVEEIAKKGDITLVRPLLGAMARNESERVGSVIHATLSDVKKDGLAEELYMALDDEELLGIRKNILSILWNAGIPINGKLEQLVNLSMSGDFQEQFEVLTILENNTKELDEEEVMNSLILVREHIQLNGEVSEVQQEILQKLQVMERFD